MFGRAYLVFVNEWVDEHAECPIFHPFLARSTKNTFCRVRNFCVCFPDYVMQLAKSCVLYLFREDFVKFSVFQRGLRFQERSGNTWGRTLVVNRGIDCCAFLVGSEAAFRLGASKIYKVLHNESEIVSITTPWMVSLYMKQKKYEIKVSFFKRRSEFR